MRNSDGRRNPSGLIIICVAFLIAAALPLISSARSSPATSVNIVNNSSRVIRNVYLSPVASDDWSNNQLGDATIGAGQSFSLNNITCDQQQIKVIGEDQDGCFVSTVVSCGSSATWTVTDDSARDCGN